MGAELESLATILDEAALAQGLQLEAPARTRLAHYAVRAIRWNRTTNVTGARDPAGFCRRFVADALAVAPYIEGGLIVDVGSGNGLPGLVLAVLKPHARIWLVEPRARRARFLRQMCIELQLANAQVVEARVEEWLPDTRPDAIVAQAVGELSYLVAITRHLQSPGCRLHALKGQAPTDEIKALGAPDPALSVRRLEVPGWSERHLVTLDCGLLEAARKA